MGFEDAEYVDLKKDWGLIATPVPGLDRMLVSEEELVRFLNEVDRRMREAFIQGKVEASMRQLRERLRVQVELEHVVSDSVLAVANPDVRAVPPGTNYSESVEPFVYGHRPIGRP